MKGGVGDEVELHASAFHPPLCDPLAAEGGFVFQLKSTPALKAALGIDSEPVSPNATARARRTTPVLFGRGLLDLVPDSVILSYADSGDRNGDGISGRPNHFVDGRLGRFGRKGFVPRLDEFNDGAFSAEMGITSPVVLTEETVGGKLIPPGSRSRSRARNRSGRARPDQRFRAVACGADPAEGKQGRQARSQDLRRYRVRGVPRSHTAHR